MNICVNLDGLVFFSSAYFLLGPWWFDSTNDSVLWPCFNRIVTTTLLYIGQWKTWDNSGSWCVKLYQMKAGNLNKFNLTSPQWVFISLFKNRTWHLSFARIGAVSLIVMSVAPTSFQTNKQIINQAHTLCTKRKR